MSPDDAIFQAFEIEPSGKEAPTEEELFQLLCDRIAWMIEHNMEYLLSLLYRNDVKESKIHFALSPYEKDPANVAIAKLVMERQKQRMATKKEYGKQNADDVEEGLRW
ncbi:MAG TPA: hypothetical protein ENJ95_17490 [Bacteroidetes bacterium]|nr:hypothetical protein [Bacteroidota bacterium]